MKAYQLQCFVYGAVDSNVALCFRYDERDYGIAAHMIKSLDVKTVKLMTNNPKKIDGLTRYGVKVTGRIPLIIPPNVHNVNYLKTKKDKSGHMLDEAFPKEGPGGSE